MKKLMAAVLAVVLLSPAVAFAGSAATNAALGLGAFAVFNQILGGVGLFGGPRPVYAARPRVVAPAPSSTAPPPVVYAPPPVVYAPPRSSTLRPARCRCSPGRRAATGGRAARITCIRSTGTGRWSISAGNVDRA